MKNDDAKLIQRVLDGDDTAFSALVKKHQKSVHALAWRKTGDFHVAEEITQDTFFKAYQSLSTLKEPQKFAGWLYVIAANYCKMWRRKKRLSTQSLEGTSSAELEKTTYSGYVTAENERVAVETQREVIKKLLAKLQESDRTVVTLYYLGEMTYEEISEFLGVSVASIKNRLYRARRRLKQEEPMIREALENFQITPNLTENIMREVSRLKQAAPSGGKPLVPWAIGVSVLAAVFLVLGIANQQSLSRFQKPYSFEAASAMKVELIDAPVVLNLEAEPDDRTQLGNVNAQDKNNGVGNRVNDAASFDLETLITKMKHYDNAVTSVTGDFTLERQNSLGISKTEYTLTFEGEKVRVDQGQDRTTVELWDGKRHWEAREDRRIIFEFEIASGKEKTDIETIRQAFKHNGIDLADDVRIVDDDEPRDFTLIENETDQKYYFWLEGETTLWVYDLQHTEYGVRDPFRRKVSDRGFQNILRYQWNMLSELDPRYWLAYPSAGGRTYLTEPLWQLLEKHESELLGSEVLNGEATSVIRLKLPDESLIIWISHEKGFRLVKLQRAFPIEDPMDILAMKYFQSGVNYIETREIDYHEYLPDVWFPKKIERYFTPIEAADLPHVAEIILKTVIRTKQCRLNTDVVESLRLNLPPDTSVFGSKPEDDTPLAEKVAYLRQEIPRILKHRLDLEKLDNEIAEFYGKDPDLTLLRDQAADEAYALKETINLLILDYIRFAADSSALKPGGDFYELLEKNGIFYDFK